MFDPMSAREFHAANGTDDWRVIGDRLAGEILARIR